MLLRQQIISTRNEYLAACFPESALPREKGESDSRFGKQQSSLIPPVSARRVMVR
jgi:hypothetical protein